MKESKQEEQKEKYFLTNRNVCPTVICNFLFIEHHHPEFVSGSSACTVW
jgi:hypothetical protein